MTSALADGRTVDTARIGDATTRATFSPDGRYRYTLEFLWGLRPLVAFVMLNPSTATATQSDPTVTRCMGYARRWDYGGLLVLNLFALRSTDPKALYEERDPIGPLNHVPTLIAEQPGVEAVVAAWGVHGRLLDRSKHVRNHLVGAGWYPFCLGLTKAGEPRHPLYLPGDLIPTRWR